MDVPLDEFIPLQGSHLEEPMSTYEIKTVVYQGKLKPSPEVLAASLDRVGSQAEPHTTARYWTLSQSSLDLRDPENSPGVSMWSFLLASAQTQRLNEISIYVGQGSTARDMRFLYLNDAALTIWKQMGKAIRITGRSVRPPRTALLSFGMPFSE